MRNALLFFATILLVLSACEKDNQSSKENNDETTDKINNELLAAYNSDNHDKLIAFLDNWEEDVPCYQVEQIGNEIHRTIYQIFMELYTPFDIGRLGNHEWGSDMYKGFDYAVVQNKIYFDYDYNMEGTDERDSIVDFRPPVSFPDKTILYLTDNYSSALNSFLQDNFNPLGTGGIMNPASPSDESALRYEYLLQEIAIIPGHWGGYWHIETHPLVYSVHLNQSVTKAKANFRVGYMFGDAELEKTTSDWIMTASAITGIE